ncbi:MAG: hypothetical protein AUH85_17495 [Chloroflexi bacterium 13_1_40CM_4_68_4]|nr:MAG: hypothetical protein AUH85_17495 [Chloroflexi bacterium 13_1_40CM_4_68_4]
MPLNLLVANRGEVARRVFRTARRMGLRTIAVYSDADAREPFVREADASLRLGPAAAGESYLSVERVLAAARETRAELVHPGYGFLAEDPAFAEAVRSAGLTFVGPPAEVLRLAGSKADAKASAARAKVPVLPGYDGAEQRDAAFVDAGRRVGYPLLVKPSAGGGGKGMLLVREERELADALASARRVARSAFGDERLILERYVSPARHVEVQFIADARGTVIGLGERDCSAQRRHQKVLEESPAPHLDDPRRAKLQAAGERLARAIGYVNAGTAEFVVDEKGDFFFLELNARLQVEHPVTEAVLGVDLVEQQLRIALGEQLSLAPRPRGHAIEVRVYAEDPANGFVPATGSILHLRWPAGVRVDGGIAEGSRITRFYDPLLAKIVAHADDRDAALRALGSALDQSQVLGVRTNVSFLRALVAHPAVREGRVRTETIERDLSTLAPPGPAVAEEAVALAASAAYARSRGRDAQRDPFAALGAWRPLGAATSPIAVRADARERIVRVSGAGPYHVGAHVASRGQEPHEWTVDGEPAAAAIEGALAWTWAASDLAAPLPGVVVAVSATAGQRVERGAVLVIVEAMKMELPVSAPAPGVVRGVRVSVGDAVERGQKLVDFESDSA